MEHPICVYTRCSLQISTRDCTDCIQHWFSNWSFSLYWEACTTFLKYMRWESSMAIENQETLSLDCSLKPTFWMISGQIVFTQCWLNFKLPGFCWISSKVCFWGYLQELLKSSQKNQKKLCYRCSLKNHLNGSQVGFALSWINKTCFKHNPRSSRNDSLRIFCPVGKSTKLYFAAFVYSFFLVLGAQISSIQWSLKNLLPKGSPTSASGRFFAIWSLRVFLDFVCPVSSQCLMDRDL